MFNLRINITTPNYKIHYKYKKNYRQPGNTLENKKW